MIGRVDVPTRAPVKVPKVLGFGKVRSRIVTEQQASSAFADHLEDPTGERLERDRREGLLDPAVLGG